MCPSFSPHLFSPLLLQIPKTSKTSTNVQDFITGIFGLPSLSLVSFAFSYVLCLNGFTFLKLVMNL